VLWNVSREPGHFEPPVAIIPGPDVQPRPRGVLDAFTCCTFDVTGAWVVAASRGGAIIYYSVIAGEVATSVSVSEVPQVLPSSCRSCWMHCCPAH
jgi:hypothetical protein